MSAEANEALMRRFLNGLDEGNLDVIDEVFSPDCVWHMPRMVSTKLYCPRVLGQWFDGIRFYAAASSPTRSRRTWAGLFDSRISPASTVRCMSA